MKLKTRFLVMCILMTFVVSCAQRSAKIVNHSRSFYGKNSKDNARSYRHIKQVGRTKKAVVREGDTLYSIAKRYQIGLHDLIRSNHLKPPYILATGTKLRIPAPSYYKVQEGDTLYAISRKHHMKINDLIALNDLEAPYRVSSGQRIKISKTSIRSGSRINTANKSQKTRAVLSKNLGKSNRFSWPVRGKVISRFGPKSGGLYNDGINIKAASGDVVSAAEDGVVAYVGNELKGYGNLVIIKHSGGWITAYAHLKKSIVTRGAKVTRGQKIGFVGSSGNVTSSQLYFGLRKGRDAVNPQSHLK